MPSDPQELIRRLSELFPENAENLRKFVLEVVRTSEGLKKLAPSIAPGELLKHFGKVFSTALYLNSALQDAFDKFTLPQAAQTLLAFRTPHAALHGRVVPLPR
jgi:all-trans-retinol 13,14-reductase